MDAQVKNLSLQHATLNKDAMLQQKTESVVLTPDSAQWEKELAVFRQIREINKPVNRSAYRVDYRTVNGATVKSITGTPKQQVQYLKLYYHQSLADVSKIEALYTENNSLFNTTRTLTMEFQSINNKSMLSSYSIVGTQKMLLGDSINFTLQGSVKIK